MTTLKFNRWTKNGIDRVYIERVTGFKRNEKVCHIDLKSGEMVPAHAQNAQSVSAYLRQANTSIDQIIAQYR